MASTKPEMEALFSRLLAQLYELEGLMADFSAQSAQTLLQERL